MSASELERLIQRYHRAVDAFVAGDPDPQKAMWSRRDDVTLANPIAPPACGWNQVETAIDRAVAQLRDGEPCQYESISGYMGGDLAYILEIQRTRAKVDATDDLRAIALRVTTVFRREVEEWRVVHRHADPLTEGRSVASIAQ